jgi:thiamine-phosphate pyrophosphorylase
MPIGRLHLLTDFHFQQRFSHAELASRAIAGGADTIQFRQKTGPLRARLVELQRTAAVCQEARVPLLVDDHVDLALAVGADGVHLGQYDLPVSLARRILGSGALIGASASTVREAREAEADGADYIGFGPVFPTRSKANPQPVRGTSVLVEVCRAVSIPVIAIAGIRPDRIRPVLEAGAHGVAVMTAITTAPDIEAATVEFRQVIDDVVG